MPWRRAAAMASVTTSAVRSPRAREDAAAVEPARALGAEDGFPVDVAGTQLRDGGMAAVGAADRAPHAEAALGEVQAVAHRPADAVVGRPAHVALVDAAAQDELFDQATDGVVGERAHHGGAQAEAAPQAARHVVFAAALVDAERAAWSRCGPRRGRGAA